MKHIFLLVVAEDLEDQVVLSEDLVVEVKAGPGNNHFGIPGATGTGGGGGAANVTDSSSAGSGGPGVVIISYDA